MKVLHQDLHAEITRAIENKGLAIAPPFTNTTKLESFRHEVHTAAKSLKHDTGKKLSQPEKQLIAVTVGRDRQSGTQREKISKSKAGQQSQPFIAEDAGIEPMVTAKLSLQPSMNTFALLRSFRRSHSRWIIEGNLVRESKSSSHQSAPNNRTSTPSLRPSQFPRSNYNPPIYSHPP